MKKEVYNFVKKISRNTLATNTQRALYDLVTALNEGDGGWIPLKKFRVSSAGARVRDLRKPQYGQFDIRCRSASRLDRSGTRHTFYYKLAQRNLTVGQLRKVFGNIA